MQLTHKKKRFLSTLPKLTHVKTLLFIEGIELLSVYKKSKQPKTKCDLIVWADTNPADNTDKWLLLENIQYALLDDFLLEKTTLLTLFKSCNRILVWDSCCDETEKAKNIQCVTLDDIAEYLPAENSFYENWLTNTTHT